MAWALITSYRDMVLAEYTQPFDQRDITFFKPLFAQTVTNLGHVPTHITADAAFDAWYIYESVAHHGGIAAVPLNKHAAQTLWRDADATPRCAKGLRMVPTFQQKHTSGYQAQHVVCPLLKPKRTGETCDHEQFLKGKGCVKDTTIEKGGLMRVMLDRTGPLYHAIFPPTNLRGRINRQAQADGIEWSKVRNDRSVAVLNPLTYLVVNATALQRARAINASLLPLPRTG